MSTQSLPLPTPATPAIAPKPRSALQEHERDRLIRRAKTLAWLSLAYIAVEGAVAITAAIIAGSVALLGFGLDSAIAGLASIVVIWRFAGKRRLSDHAEQRAERLVAISFFLLAPYVAPATLRALINTDPPRISWMGIGLTISSMLVMPLLGRAKHRIGSQLGSGATAGERTQNMLCAYLAASVLVGLALNVAFGLSWADPYGRARHRRARPKKAARPGAAKAAAPPPRSPQTPTTPAGTTAAPDPRRPVAPTNSGHHSKLRVRHSFQRRGFALGKQQRGGRSQSVESSERRCLRRGHRHCRFPPGEASRRHAHGRSFHAEAQASGMLHFDQEHKRAELDAHDAHSRDGDRAGTDRRARTWAKPSAGRSQAQTAESRPKQRLPVGLDTPASAAGEHEKRSVRRAYCWSGLTLSSRRLISANHASPLLQGCQ